MRDWSCSFLCLAICVAASSSKDITTNVFGDVKNVLPAAFGDFNSDALIDMFVLSSDYKTFQILLAASEPPLFRPSELTCSFDSIIGNIVPGDFNGDALMDVMVTTLVKRRLYKVHIFWGHLVSLDCKPGLEFLTTGQPLAMDYNQDMIIDLFGEDENSTRTFWIFNSNGTEPKRIVMEKPSELKEFLPIAFPHSNAFINLRPTEKFLPDLVVATNDYYEIWRGTDNGFEFSKSIMKPKAQVGQFLYLDVQLACQLDLVVPICYSENCDNATIAVYSKDTWYPLELLDSTNTKWSFPNAKNGGSSHYNTQTLRGGDFNLDGYPDLLATLMVGNQLKSVLLQNVECSSNCKGFGRTFEIIWDALSPFSNGSAMAAFYDFKQNGILDVILVLKQGGNSLNDYRIAALQNTMDYDANFVKVMVITGLTNDKYPIAAGSIGQKKRTYGTNLPGPSISYRTTTQDGLSRCGVAAQLPQSAHHVLALPFTTFGLGRTPNFIDSLVARVATLHHEYPQIIPNSQLVIIPNPINDASGWKAQLFITPSDLILQSAIALAGVCVLIMLIIFGLYWKERRQDKIEKLQEAHRFHFDAM